MPSVSMMMRRNPPPGGEQSSDNSRKFFPLFCVALTALSLLCRVTRNFIRNQQFHDVIFSDDSGEPNFRVQEKGINESDTKKTRFGGLLKDGPIKGFSGEALKRPITGLFRKTGKGPNKKKEEDETPEPSIAAPPTNFPSMARISATLESVQLDEEFTHFRERNPENGSKTTLNGAALYGITTVHPLQRYFKVDDIDISILARALPTEMRKDEDVPWTAQSLFNSLEGRVKKERLEARDQRTGSAHGANRRLF